MGFVEYFNVATDISRGFDHHKHELKYHDADMRKNNWWDQYSLKGFAKSVGRFVDGVTGGEKLQNMDTKEEKENKLKQRELENIRPGIQQKSITFTDV
jgi:hypothetical protein